MIIMKISINVFKLFNILTSERKFLKVSQKCCVVIQAQTSYYIATILT